MRKIILSTGISMLLWANTLLAQDSLKILNEVVVTATRTEQEIIDVARSVEVINEKDIRQSSYNSVGELLSRKTALFIVGSTQTPGTNQDVFLRGANSNHIAVLIDGVRVTDPSSPNSAFNLAELSLANVERIEIVYGAHSTLYGTAAMGGTINIITKTGAKGLNGYGSINGGIFGEGNLLEGSGYVNYGFENGFYISGSAYHQSVNGIDASRDTITAATFKTADQDDFYKTDISVKTGFKNQQWESFIEYKRADQQSEIDDGAFNDDDNYFVDLKRDFVNYGVNYKNGKWKLTFNGGYSYSERTAVNDSSVVDNNNNYDRTYFSSAHHGRLMTNEVLLNYTTDGATFIFGLGDYREAMDFNTYYYSNGVFGPYESEVNYDSLYISSSIQHAFLAGDVVPFGLNRLNVSYGIRLNHHSNYGNHFTWEINPSFRIGKNATAYVSYAKGFNAPSLYQLYDPTTGTITKRGNQSLQPETGRSFEIGWKQFITPDIALTLSFFDNKVQDAIEYVYIWNGETPVEQLSYVDYFGDTYINVNKQHVKGVEASAEALLTSKLKLNLNATFLNGKITVSPDEIEMDEIGENHLQIFSNGRFVSQETDDGNLIRRPSFIANAGLGYELNKAIRINLDYQYIGDRFDVVYDQTLGPFGALGTLEMGAYHLMNISGNYRISEKFNALLSIKNILNEKYSEINGFNTMGRGGYLKLIYEF